MESDTEKGINQEIVNRKDNKVQYSKWEQRK